MAITVQVKRGTYANMPALADGEFYVATDTKQLYVGLGGLALAVGGSMATVSLSDTTGKSAVMKTGQLTTTAVTANQVVLTYTVTALKTLFLQYLNLQGRLTAASATGSVLGTMTVNIGGVAVYTGDFVNPTNSTVVPLDLVLSEPIPVAAGTVVSITVTPTAVTSMRWTGNFGGFEK